MSSIIVELHQLDKWALFIHKKPNTHTQKEIWQICFLFKHTVQLRQHITQNKYGPPRNGRPKTNYEVTTNGDTAAVWLLIVLFLSIYFFF